MTNDEILKKINARLDTGNLNVDLQLVLLTLKDVLLNQAENDLRLGVVKDRLSKVEAVRR